LTVVHFVNNPESAQNDKGEEPTAMWAFLLPKEMWAFLLPKEKFSLISYYVSSLNSLAKLSNRSGQRD